MNDRQPDVARSDQSRQPEGRRGRPWSLAPRVSRRGDPEEGQPEREPDHGTQCSARGVRKHRGPGRQELGHVSGPGERDGDQGKERGLRRPTLA